MSQTTEAQIAAFLARGGRITKVEEGVRAIASDRRIYAAFRDGRTIAADAVEETRQSQYDAENAAERRFETFVGARFAGASVSDALDAATTAATRRYR